MKGVMTPGVSAGSNHVGANEMCTPQVSCPSGPVALAGPWAPTIEATMRSVKLPRTAARVLKRRSVLLRRTTLEIAEANRLCVVVMACPPRLHRRTPRNIQEAPTESALGRHAFLPEARSQRNSSHPMIFEFSALASRCPDAASKEPMRTRIQLSDAP